MVRERQESPFRGTGSAGVQMAWNTAGRRPGMQRGEVPVFVAGESVQGKAGCWPCGVPAGQGCSGRLSSENGSAGNLVFSCCKSSVIIQNFRIHM